MSSMHDIYDPPPPPVSWVPPSPGLVAFTRWDVAWLVGLAVGIGLLSLGLAWFEPTLGLLLFVGGMLVLLESWYTALEYLGRQDEEPHPRRWAIFLGAFVPWLIGLGLAALLMIGLFSISDWVF
jgi:hypothetical protein